MRLIDADQFGVISFQGESDDFIEGAKYMLEKIDDAPTLPNPCGKPCAFVRPHGEWVRAFNMDRATVCSECGEEAWYKSYCGWVTKSNFCPECGADMRPKEGEVE